MKFMFSEDSWFSWRKGITFIAAILIVAAISGYLIKHGFEELPTSYIVLLGSIVAFYFGKDAMRKIKLNGKHQDK